MVDTPPSIEIIPLGKSKHQLHLEAVRRYKARNREKEQLYSRTYYICHKDEINRKRKVIRDAKNFGKPKMKRGPKKKTELLKITIC